MRFECILGDIGDEGWDWWVVWPWLVGVGGWVWMDGRVMVSMVGMVEHG